jgi:hypothetical protein
VAERGPTLWPEEEGSVRPDVDPSVVGRLLFGTVNFLAEWYRRVGPVGR